jgi:L-serine dehydratase
MILMALSDAQGDVILQETYYSIGGGFVMTEGELAMAGRRQSTDEKAAPVSLSVQGSAQEMLAMGNGPRARSIAEMKWANEISRGGAGTCRSGVARTSGR